MQLSQLVLAVLVGLVGTGCRPTVTTPTTQPPRRVTEAKQTTTDEPDEFTGPTDPSDPRVVFEWIDAHVTELRQRRLRSLFHVSKRKLDDRTIELMLDDGTLHAVAVETVCGEHEEYDEGIWTDTFGSTTRSYYLLRGDVVAVLEEEMAGFSSNEIGECINYESTEAYFVWGGRLLAHWTQEHRVNCYCADVDDEVDDPYPCELDQFRSDRPEATSLSFSDDPIVGQFRGELRELALADGQGPLLECPVTEDY